MMRRIAVAFLGVVTALWVFGADAKTVLLYFKSSAVSVTTTWNPSDKDTGITLSSGNLVATSSTSLANCTTGAGVCSVRAIASHSTGKYYWEIVVTNLGGAANDDNIGVANATFPIFNTILGGDVNSVSYRHANLPLGATCTSTPDNFVSGDNLKLAFDLTNKLMWMKVNAGNWNGDATGDPVAGIKGCDFSTIAAGPYFPTASGSNDANTVFTANFGGSAYVGTPPTGYGNW